MAGDMYRKPLAGGPLDINARLMGQMIDAARGEKRNLQGYVSQQFRQADIVLVKNSTANAVAQFGIMGIDAPVITPTANLDEFKGEVLLSCVAPLTTKHKNKCVILQEPLASGAIGRAVIAGVTLVKVTGATGVGLTFAEITNSDTTKMTMGATGSARVLWAESGSVERWAVVRINDGPTFRYRYFCSGASGSGTGSILDCFDGTPATLTGTVTNKTGCYTGLPDTIGFAFSGVYFEDTTSPGDLELAACPASSTPNMLIQHDGINPYLTYGPGNFYASPGWTCGPASMVFQVDDGLGNSCTITVVE